MIRLLRSPVGRASLAALVPLSAFVVLAGPGAASTTTHRPPRAGVVRAVGAENEYADVIRQIGGRFVRVLAAMRNPNTDPHEFEASPALATAVSGAELIVQNGLGYDAFMNAIESAAPSRTRRVIDVQHLLGLPDSTANPHLWYKPTTMPAVARAVAGDLSVLVPAERRYFATNLATFDASLAPWTRELAKIRAIGRSDPVAVTEPVGDYLLQAAGLDIRTPFGFEADVMNGVDPPPQDITYEEDLLVQHGVKVFVYNQQVVDTVSATLLGIAEAHRVPVVGVYETMPTPGFDYQRWMLAETTAIERAVRDGISTPRL